MKMSKDKKTESYFFSAENNASGKIVAHPATKLFLNNKCKIIVVELSFPIENCYNMLTEYNCFIIVGSNKYMLPYRTNVEDLVYFFNKELVNTNVALKVLRNGRILAVNNTSASTMCTMSHSLAQLLGFNVSPGNNYSIPFGYTNGERIFNSDMGFSYVELICNAVYDRVSAASFGKFVTPSVNNFTWTGNREKNCKDITVEKLEFSLFNGRGEIVPIEKGKILVHGYIEMNYEYRL